MLGVILCGGQSTRMGSDKGMLKLHARTWAQTAVDKIAELYLPVVLSVNEQQYQDYATVFSTEQLIMDNETIKFKGPLCGVLSVHCQYQQKDLFVLACDMPLIETAVLKELLQQYLLHTGYDAYIFTNDGEPEPLCAIYRAKALSKIIALNQHHQLPKHSMKYMLEQISFYELPLTAEQKKYFRNFNAHSELNGM
ncbi:MAG TPA: molybdenum cofactor guanylyltransferase [Chitinophagaceae bacterium]|jgi:molybdopterin-guanine dinucleotide biosynthesis protein A|nr:molybdenum cofactor guanylyltransferase [Chitinophagaceae bacterium]